MPVQPGDQPGQPPSPRRPGMRTGTGIFLITAGAVLLFALRSSSPHWLNLQIVGVILILAGGLGLMLPQLARSRRERMRQWARPGQPEDPGGPANGPDQATSGPPARAPDASPTTLADDLLSYQPHH